jgi:hypothetical protein
MNLYYTRSYSGFGMWIIAKLYRHYTCNDQLTVQDFTVLQDLLYEYTKQAQYLKMNNLCFSRKRKCGWYQKLR